jgi:hypothetical protein
VGAVERHVKGVFDLLRRRPMPPPAREIGDARHVKEGDNAAFVGTNAGLALSLERGACLQRDMRPIASTRQDSGLARV